MSKREGQRPSLASDFGVEMKHDLLDLRAVPGVVRDPFFDGGWVELPQNLLVGLCSAGVGGAVHDVSAPWVRGVDGNREQPNSADKARHLWGLRWYSLRTRNSQSIGYPGNRLAADREAVLSVIGQRPGSPGGGI